MWTRRWISGAVMAVLSLAMPSARVSQSSARQKTASAVFAAGCFWCVEQAFDEVDGVLETTSGYTGGTRPNPTYEEVSSGGTGHAEALKVTYDPSKVTYDRLLQQFWHNVDAVDGGGQFCDRGSQYRPAIFYGSPDEQQAAEASKKQTASKLGKAVAVQIAPVGPFYAAEQYHQDYHKKNPVRYKFYKWNCGRAQRLEQLWGKTAHAE